MMTVTPYGTTLDPPFNMPAGVAIASDGSIFTADGYGNRQVHRFSAEGELEISWGTSGIEPGQFALVHQIGIDSQDRILICDRESSRIQFFDREGEFITMWEDVNGPGDVYCSPDQLIYVAEQGGSLGKGPAPIGVSIFHESGELVGRFRGEETGPVDAARHLVRLKGKYFCSRVGHRRQQGTQVGQDLTGNDLELHLVLSLKKRVRPDRLLSRERVCPA